MSIRTTTDTATSPAHGQGFRQSSPIPGLLVAWAPQGAATVDRCVVSDPFVVGRSSDCGLPVRNDKTSKRHFKISRHDQGFAIEDLGSRNGTYVNSTPVSGSMCLDDGSVLRAGEALLVFHEDIRSFMESTDTDRHAMAGRFHTGVILRDLKEASLSTRHLLIAGPTGTGKELAARALASLMGKRGQPLKILAHNAARFANEDEAMTTLFGVAAGVFSNVAARAGLIEQADGGILFLDEVHNFPERIQRSLLRVIEDGQASRVGDRTSRVVDVRFVLASNAGDPSHGLAPDLMARLRVFPIPSLSKRTADIPSIFDAILRLSLEKKGLAVKPVLDLLGADHYEALCLDGFKRDNIRGLVDLADRTSSRMAAGSSPADAILAVFNDRFHHGPVAARYCEGESLPASASHYERNKDLIITAYRECGGNLSAAERLLRSRGIRCSRRWLMIFAKKWGLRP